MERIDVLLVSVQRLATLRQKTCQRSLDAADGCDFETLRFILASRGVDGARGGVTVTP